MEFAWLKGHGTENDFVILPDPDGSVFADLSAEFVAALCNRRTGIGADGVLRAVRQGPLWFMDYRNADGSISEMCGNGIRVFARYLLQAGLVEGSEFDVATRDGVKHLRVDGDLISVDMGRFTRGGSSKVTTSEGRSFGADEVHTGNPHAVAFVDDVSDAGSLLSEPIFDRDVYPAGVNIEFVARRGERHVAMRVHERGSGETRSCGTGACAVAIATAAADQLEGPARYQVDVPGGSLWIDVNEDSTTTLSGPAVIVARGSVEWLHG